MNEVFGNNSKFSQALIQSLSTAQVEKGQMFWDADI